MMHSTIVITAAVGVPLTVLLLAGIVQMQQAQAKAQTQIAGFNNVTIGQAIANNNRAVDILVLRNASYDKRLDVFTQTVLFKCINVALYAQSINQGNVRYNLAQQILGNCDNAFSSALANRSTNTTSYLKTNQPGFTQPYVPISLHNSN